MPDMLARLYDLPDLAPEMAAMAAIGIDVRPALALEKPGVLAWVTAHYPGWRGEADIAFARQPIACHIALNGRELVGFACYDSTCRNFFGPMAVDDTARMQGIGRVLLLSVLHAQRAQGYAYSVIGGVGPAEFYARAVGAVLISGSDRGILAPLTDGRTVRNPGGKGLV